MRNFLRRFLFNSKCSLCQKEITEGYICLTCIEWLKENSEIKKTNDVYYLYKYQDIKDMIFDFKFKNRRYISKELKEIVKLGVEKVLELEKIDVILPVPISEKRGLERGFNQVEELLKWCELEYVNIERVKETEKMFNLRGKVERKENISEAFFIREEDVLKEKNILIVDDIVTTGSTMKELEKELRKKDLGKNIVFFSLAISKGNRKG